MSSWLLSVAEYLTPVLRVSQFMEKGVLTPEEFVAAGEQLVRTCGTWEWSGGEPSALKSYLPPDKQMLVTRNVPSYTRVADVAGAPHSSLDQILTVEQEPTNDGSTGPPDEWVTTTAVSWHDDKVGTLGKESESTDAVGSLDVAASDPVSESSVSAAGSTSGASTPAVICGLPLVEAKLPESLVVEDSGYLDTAAFEDRGLIEDPSAVPYLRAEEPEDTIFRTRTYNLSIVYDKYYQTPRVYLDGRDEHNNPLLPEQIFEDVVQDYANRTVTIEAHPHLPSAGMHASIHPCRHAETMKRIIDRMAAGGHEARVDQYMIIFLKFIQSVIPTINFDSTFTVETASSSDSSKFSAAGTA